MRPKIKARVWSWRGRQTGRVFWVWKCSWCGEAITTDRETWQQVVIRASDHVKILHRK